MITAVDTNILLDILIPNTKFLRASKQLLDKANAKGTFQRSHLLKPKPLRTLLRVKGTEFTV